MFLYLGYVSDVAKLVQISVHEYRAILHMNEYTRSENRALQCADVLTVCKTSNKSVEESGAAKREALKALQSL